MTNRHAENFLQAHETLKKSCDELATTPGIKMVMMVDLSGQLLVSSGETEKQDLTALAALAAGAIAATGGMAQRMKENQFSTLFFEGQHQRILIDTIGDSAALIINFDRSQSFGFMRFQAQKRLDAMKTQVGSILKKVASGQIPDNLM